MDEASIQHDLIQALVSVTKKLDVSSLHVNFILPDEISLFETSDFLSRTGIQYHWVNKDYETFNDFLSTLTSRKRKNIKKERKIALESGVKITALNGDDIKEQHWHAFYNFYLDTTKKGEGRTSINLSSN